MAGSMTKSALNLARLSLQVGQVSLPSKFASDRIFPTFRTSKRPIRKQNLS